MAQRSHPGPIRGIPAPVNRRSQPGAPVPLFERLVDEDPDIPYEPRPYRTFGMDGLRHSVLAELSRLFNTRAPVSAEDLQRWPRTVITYGIPDFATYAADGPEGHTRFSRHAVAAIEVYEPRLSSPRVTVTRDVSSRQPRWFAVIEGVIVCGAVKESLRFEQDLVVQAITR